ncbi:glycosyltransferase family 4 protein [Candidatus Peregrinibacteria bacterium]|nr:glycosyltransferase family 4 protein [Candidatus Peregrinibacteria bacterium]
MQQSPKKSKTVFKPRIAFVIPWFSENISGGAEAEAKALIEHLKPYFEIEVLTTCVKDFLSCWNENFWKEGEYAEMGVKIRRFTVRERDTLAFDIVNAKLMNGRGGDYSKEGSANISQSEEETYIAESVRSLSLNDYLEKNRDFYEWFLFIPYMFGTTYDGIKIVKEKAVLIACLHDESYAYLDIYKEMIGEARKVFLHVNAEKRLAERIFGASEKFVIVGEGVDFEGCDVACNCGLAQKVGGSWKSMDGRKFSEKYGLKDFVLYAGRKDTTKNTPQLVEFFDRFVKETGSELELVLIGPGEIPLPDNPQIKDLGFLDKEEKYAAMKEARFLCNPSLNESFSIVLMESWLCNKPVLVNGNCAVTKDHVLSANGGLYYEDYYTFAECMKYLLEHREEAGMMAKNGKEYVLTNFTWDRVVQNYLKALND